MSRVSDRSGATAWRALLAASVLMGACKGPSAAKKSPPASVQNAPKEEQLATVTLSPEAEARLGVEIAKAEWRVVERARSVGGEVMAPPGRSNLVNAPMAGTLVAPPRGAIPPPGSPVKKGQVVVGLVPLPPAGDVAAAEIRLQAARTKVNRAEQLLRDGAGSRRALEEARVELDLAEAGVRAGRAPGTADDGLPIASPQDGVVGDLRVGVGQSVPAGAALFQVDALSPMWVRVPVYVGDVSDVVPGRPATITMLSAAPGEGGKQATPAKGPPSATADAATSDLYYELPNHDGALRPGQKVAVSLPLRGSGESLVVPWSAVLYDIHGGTWVYQKIGPHVYARRRVEVGHVAGDLAVVRGPAPGTEVVSVGAAEIFGTEFGMGK